MTTNVQIRDEKLQYNINKEAAKIFALSSAKIRKYEYLTCEDILPSNQQQITEQTKFIYSPLGKAFEKQIKAFEDQWEKQKKAIQDQGYVKTILKYAYDSEHTQFVLKQKKINELVDDRREKLTCLDETVNSNNLMYRYKGTTGNVKFDKFLTTLLILSIKLKMVK